MLPLSWTEIPNRLCGNSGGALVNSAREFGKRPLNYIPKFRILNHARNLILLRALGYLALG